MIPENLGLYFNARIDATGSDTLPKSFCQYPFVSLCVRLFRYTNLMALHRQMSLTYLL